jgi:hypothetical protein
MLWHVSYVCEVAQLICSHLVNRHAPLPILPSSTEMFHFAPVSTRWSESSSLAVTSTTRARAAKVCEPHSRAKDAWTGAHNSCRSRALCLRGSGVVPDPVGPPLKIFHQEKLQSHFPGGDSFMFRMKDRKVPVLPQKYLQLSRIPCATRPFWTLHRLSRALSKAKSLIW